jgi:hypothetical protein
VCLVRISRWGIEGMRRTTKMLGTPLKEWAKVIFYINTPQLFE